MEDRAAERDRQHLHLLSVFHFVAAGLALLWSAGYLAMFRIMRDGFASLWSAAEETAREAGRPRPPRIPWEAFGRMQEAMMTAIVAIALAALLICLVNGVLLRCRRARMASIVLGGALCLWMPFGTVLGIFTILVLCRPSVAASYEARAGKFSRVP